MGGKTLAECRWLSTYYKVAMTLTWLTVIVSGSDNTAKDFIPIKSLALDYESEAGISFLETLSSGALPDKNKEEKKRDLSPALWR
jgi:hypothetical protein